MFVHFAPLPGRGRIANTRVRGIIREYESMESPPSSRPFPASGATEKWSRRFNLTYHALVQTRSLLDCLPFVAAHELLLQGSPCTKRRYAFSGKNRLLRRD